jgi:hypothetical protein
MSSEGGGEPEVKAISALIAALKPLDPDARAHVLEFVLKRLGISLSADASLVAGDVASIEPPNQPPSVTDRVVKDLRCRKSSGDRERESGGDRLLSCSLSADFRASRPYCCRRPQAVLRPSWASPSVSSSQDDTAPRKKCGILQCPC